MKKLFLIFLLLPFCASAQKLSYGDLSNAPTVQGLVTGNTSAASANVTALQAALTAGGLVDVRCNGALYINQALVIPSKTHLQLSQGCVLTPSVTMGNLLVNYAYNNRGWVSTAPTYVSGASACTNGTQVVTFTNGSGIVAASGSITVSGGVPTGAVSLFQPGAMYQTAPTTGTIATCTGTATFSGAAITGAAHPVTLTWSSGYSVSVSWTAHGLTAGQYVYIAGVSPSAYDGVFPIISVTDANTFVIYVKRIPTTTPTGSAAALVADQDVSVTGGTFDYNYGTNTVSTPAGSPGSMPIMNGIVFGAIQNGRIQNTSVLNVQKYGIQVSADRDVDINHIRCATRSDCVHYYGPSTAVKAEFISGTTGDDVVAVNSSDYNTNYDWATGDIINVDVGMLDANSSATINEAVISGDATNYVGGIHIHDLSGTVATNCVAITNQVTGAATIDDVYIENNNCVPGVNALKIDPNYYLGSTSTMTVGSVDYKNSTVNQSSNTQPAIYVGPGATLDRFNIDGLTSINTAYPASGGNYVVNAAGSSTLATTIKALSFKNIDFNTAAGRFFSVSNYTTLPLIIFDTVRAFSSSLSSFVNVQSTATSIPSFVFRNSNFNGQSYALVCAFSCNAIFSGNTFTSMTAVALANGTVTTNFTDDGTNTYSSAPFSAVSGSPTLTTRTNQQLLYSATNVALPTGSIANGCTAATGSPFTAPGVTTSSKVNFGWYGDPTGVSGYGTVGGLAVRVSPGSGTVIVKLCNPNSSAITAGTQSINVWATQ